MNKSIQSTKKRKNFDQVFELNLSNRFQQTADIIYKNMLGKIRQFEHGYFYYISFYAVHLIVLLTSKNKRTYSRRDN